MDTVNIDVFKAIATGKTAGTEGISDTARRWVAEFIDTAVGPQSAENDDLREKFAKALDTANDEVRLGDNPHDESRALCETVCNASLWGCARILNLLVPSFGPVLLTAVTCATAAISCTVCCVCDRTLVCLCS